MPIRHVVSVPDQTHVADLLMKDVGKFPRDKEVLDKVSAISRDTHGRRKLLPCVHEIIALNSSVVEGT